MPSLLPRSRMLTTGKVCFALSVDPSLEGIVDRALACLVPVFRDGPVTEEPHYSIRIEPMSALPAAIGRYAAEPFALRRSSSQPFNLTLNIGRTPDGRRIGIDAENETAYVSDPAESELVIHVTEASHYHLLETLRYTALAAEQARGTVILHASAAVRDGEAVLVLGDKGRGKSTTLLRLLIGHGLGYLSGDKVLVDVHRGQLRLRGWPDYPHVGIGTLSLFPDLAKGCGVRLIDDGGNLRPAGDKILIEPAIYLRALDVPVFTETDVCHSLLFPDVRADSDAIRPAVEGKVREALLRGAIEDARIFTPGQWHGLIDTPPALAESRLANLLADALWYEIPGRSVDLDRVLEGRQA